MNGDADPESPQNWRSLFLDTHNPQRYHCGALGNEGNLVGPERKRCGGPNKHLRQVSTQGAVQDLTREAGVGDCGLVCGRRSKSAWACRWHHRGVRVSGT